MSALKKLSTKTFNADWGVCTEEKYRLHLEHTHVSIVAETTRWSDGQAEFRVDFWTGKTRQKIGGMHRWKEPIKAFRAIAAAIEGLYAQAPKDSRVFVIAADEARLSVYRRAVLRRWHGNVWEFVDKDGFPAIELLP